MPTMFNRATALHGNIIRIKILNLESTAQKLGKLENIIASNPEDKVLTYTQF